MTRAPILLTGGSGLLGSALRRVDQSLIAPPRTELDITLPDDIERALDHYSPGVVIHAAAIADTRRCAADPKVCWITNATATATLALACRRRSVRLVYISTDYVFDGEKGNYCENDPTNPLMPYGKTKLAGELAVRALDAGLVVRTTFCATDRWKFPAAFVDQFTSRERVDLVAPDILLAARSNLGGVIHIAGPRRSLFDLARSIDPTVKPTQIDAAGAIVPRDISLCVHFWQQERHRLMA